VVLTLLMLIGDYRDRGECPVVEPSPAEQAAEVEADQCIREIVQTRAGRRLAALLCPPYGGDQPPVVLLQHQVVRVAGHSGRPRQDQVRRELLGEPGDGPQALEVLDDWP